MVDAQFEKVNYMYYQSYKTDEFGLVTLAAGPLNPILHIIMNPKVSIPCLTFVGRK